MVPVTRKRRSPSRHLGASGNRAEGAAEAAQQTGSWELPGNPAAPPDTTGQVKGCPASSSSREPCLPPPTPLRSYGYPPPAGASSQSRACCSPATPLPAHRRSGRSQTATDSRLAAAPRVKDLSGFIPRIIRTYHRKIDRHWLTESLAVPDPQRRFMRRSRWVSPRWSRANGPPASVDRQVSASRMTTS
jgi:hypothetical protein